MSSNLDVKEIDLAKKIQLRENELKMAEIEGEMIFEREKTKIETEFLAAFEEAKMYPALLTQKYLNFLAYDALTSNLTMVMGDRVPNIELNRFQKLWFYDLLKWSFYKAVLIL